MWTNREEGGRALAAALSRWKGRHPLILAIPRGAVPMGAIVADALHADLDVVLVHKIGHPMQPELAIGAVDEHGRFVGVDEGGLFGIPKGTIETLGREEVAKLKRRRQLYGGEPADVRGRTVILVDDGIATGSTMLAAVKAVRAAGAAEVVVAAPVASREAAERLRGEADHLVLLQTPPFFMAVGQFYREFGQVEDDEVSALLRTRRAAPVAPA